MIVWLNWNPFLPVSTLRTLRASKLRAAMLTAYASYANTAMRTEGSIPRFSLYSCPTFRGPLVVNQLLFGILQLTLDQRCVCKKKKGLNMNNWEQKDFAQNNIFENPPYSQYHKIAVLLSNL